MKLKMIRVLTKNNRKIRMSTCLPEKCCKGLGPNLHRVVSVAQTDAGVVDGDVDEVQEVSQGYHLHLSCQDNKISTLIVPLL